MTSSSGGKGPSTPAKEKPTEDAPGKLQGHASPGPRSLWSRGESEGGWEGSPLASAPRVGGPQQQPQSPTTNSSASQMAGVRGQFMRQVPSNTPSLVSWLPTRPDMEPPTMQHDHHNQPQTRLPPKGGLPEGASQGAGPLNGAGQQFRGPVHQQGKALKGGCNIWGVPHLAPVPSLATHPVLPARSPARIGINASHAMRAAAEAAAAQEQQQRRQQQLQQQQEQQQQEQQQRAAARVETLFVLLAKTLTHLPLHQRSLMVDAMRRQSVFVGHFPGPAAGNALINTHVAPTDTQRSALALSLERMQAQTPPRPPTQHGTPPPHAMAPTVATAPVTVSCIPELESYGSSDPNGSLARVLVSVTGTEATTQASVAATFVVDVSDDMPAPRLDIIKASLHAIVDEFTCADYLGFVVEGSVGLPLMLMTANAKLLAHTVVDSLAASVGSTLYANTVQAIRQQQELATAHPLVSRAVFLCTDTPDTDPMLPLLLQQHSTRLHPVPLFTFGLGDSHSQGLLQAVAAATSGSYYYVCSMMDMLPALQEVVGRLRSVVARNLCVYVEQMSRGVRLMGLQSGGVMSDARVTFTDLLACEDQGCLLTFGLPPSPPPPAPADPGPSSLGGSGVAARHETLAAVVVTYTDAATGAVARHLVPVHVVRTAVDGTMPAPEVTTAVARHDTAEAISQACQLSDTNPSGAAHQLGIWAAQLFLAKAHAPAAAEQLDQLSALVHLAAHLLLQVATGLNIPGAVQGLTIPGALQRARAITQAMALELRGQQRVVMVGTTARLPPPPGLVLPDSLDGGADVPQPQAAADVGGGQRNASGVAVVQLSPSKMK